MDRKAEPAVCWGARAERCYKDVCGWIWPLHAQAVPGRVEDAKLIVSKAIHEAHHCTQPHRKNISVL